MPENVEPGTPFAVDHPLYRWDIDIGEPSWLLCACWEPFAFVFISVCGAVDLDVCLLVQLP